jgi:hypothetical protein
LLESPGSMAVEAWSGWPNVVKETGLMSESVDARPSNQVLPHELPASLGDPILVTWIREPLDDAVAFSTRTKVIGWDTVPAADRQPAV